MPEPRLWVDDKIDSPEYLNHDASNMYVFPHVLNQNIFGVSNDPKDILFKELAGLFIIALLQNVNPSTSYRVATSHYTLSGPDRHPFLYPSFKVLQLPFGK